jgi:hypothetical protein
MQQPQQLDVQHADREQHDEPCRACQRLASGELQKPDGRKSDQRKDEREPYGHGRVSAIRRHSGREPPGLYEGQATGRADRRRNADARADERGADGRSREHGRVECGARRPGNRCCPRRTGQTIELHAQLAPVVGPGNHGGRAGNAEDQARPGRPGGDIDRDVLIIVGRRDAGTPYPIDQDLDLGLGHRVGASAAEAHRARPRIPPGQIGEDEVGAGSRPGERFQARPLDTVEPCGHAPRQVAVHLQDELRTQAEGRRHARGGDGRAHERDEGGAEECLEHRWPRGLRRRRTNAPRARDGCPGRENGALRGRQASPRATAAEPTRHSSRCRRRSRRTGRASCNSRPRSSLSCSWNRRESSRR